ncbi:cyclic nucleotide-binding domain-containing protein [Pendulispora albinea]|uniref:Mechanosensitive ion channel family protein n=1 Tax=Pendulispora albinea TaxID=2741071 RepID=A0ABZ2LJ32_9BACT
MDWTRLHETLADWTFVFIGGLVVLVAGLANRFLPQSRKHMRRTIGLYGVYVACHGLGIFLTQAGFSTWGPRFRLGSEFFEAFTLVALTGFVVFDLLLPRLKVDLVSITSDIILGIAYLVTALGVAHEAGMDPTSVLATSAIVSAVLALSLQATLGNILGGVALQLDGSIHVGDFIQLESGRQGEVKEIRWRHTVVEMINGDTIIVPNASLLAQNIVLMGKRENAPLQRRVSVFFNVDFRHNPQTVVQVVSDVLCASHIPNVADNPKPDCVCLELAHDVRHSFGYYAARYWLTDFTLEEPTSSAIRARIHAGLRRSGIPLAHPVQSTFSLVEETANDKSLRLRDRRLSAMRAVDLFQGLTDEERLAVAERLQPTPFAAGETITRQGATAHYLYLLTRGRVEIRMRTEGESRVVGTVEGPDFFGEMGLMTGEARTADVVAVTDVDCYKLDRSGFEEILRNRPEVAEGMSQTMAKRRVGLIAARDGLDLASKRAREASEQQRILGKIRDFFGLLE